MVERGEPRRWSPRQRRLASDLEQMNELAGRLPAVSFRAEGDPPETYHVLINAPGIARSPSGGLSLRNIHRCTVYLHSDYPRRPPVITWRTPIVHPNILPPERNGGVCLGSWNAGESLADLVERLVALVTYEAFNCRDALDKEAAAWADACGLIPGADLDAVVNQARASRAHTLDVSLSGAANDRP